MSQAATYRDFTFGVTRALAVQRGGSTYLVAEQALQPYPDRLTDRLQHWAQTVPERTWMARRGAAGEWVKISYAQAWQQAQSIGQAMLSRGLSAERPVAILSENSLEHALLAIGCMTVGVPYCSVSPAYSLLSQDFDKLRHVITTLTPGLVYASDWARYGKAIAAAVPRGTEIVINEAIDASLPSLNTPNSIANYPISTSEKCQFSSLIVTPATEAVQHAMRATHGDTIVKFLFTSGSTKLPKAVINTQRMCCANQQQMLQSMPALAHNPPVLVDWLPWNHTFGGNHNFGLVLYHGGTLYIDDGRPVPALMAQTLRNLREIAPTQYFNVPTGFEQIAQAMQADSADGIQLRKTLLSRCNMFFYAGAALAQPIWDSLFQAQEREIGQRIVMGTGLGMTESGPYGLFITSTRVKAGDLGLPTPGMELKLVPHADSGKTEVRYRGPNITPGYWRNPEATAESFDDEGFFCTGDAVQWIDPSDLHQGLKFDGRIAEDFKLATGTFVSVGPLRAKIIAAGAPYIQDVVIAGLNEKEVGALIIPALGPAKKLCGLADSSTIKDIANSSIYTSEMCRILSLLSTTATGSASRIARAVVLDEPLSIDRGEVTDKGSVNQRAVLSARADLVQALYGGTARHIIEPTPP
jgi:feruloyl-CoA synthase